jgi:hypothetical protein
MTELDVMNLIAETNKHLKPNQQIHPDDPIVVNMIVNQQILNVQITAIKKELGGMLRESFDQLSASIQLQVQRAAVAAERMISNGGNEVVKQLDTAAQRWEERLRKAGTESEASKRRASRLAWGCTALCILSVCVLMGSYLGNYVFCLLRHTPMHQGKSFR